MSDPTMLHVISVFIIASVAKCFRCDPSLPTTVTKFSTSITTRPQVWST